MSDPVAPRILVCVHEPSALAELRRLLAAGGHDASGHLFGTPDPELNGYQLVVVDASKGSDALDLCRRLRGMDEVFAGRAF